MKRIMIKIAYDGTNYNGWQTGDKKNGIEDIINAKLSILTNEKIEIIGTSRTDSKVHSNGNIAVFDTNSDIRPDKFNYALNNLLPNDISILESKEVSSDFHPRKHNVIKTYIYKIHNAKIRNPLKEHFAHYVYHSIDIEKMKEASKYLIGVHDFKSFINPDSQSIKLSKLLNYEDENVTTREIYSIDIKENDDIIEIKISGNGFLYHMVRIICGTLLKIGMNMWEPSYIKEILEKKDRRYAGFTLPAKGLTLESIEFI
ncbi:MAG: tRNA pseudouridine(38-40) synthase TruA [Lachnospiraceae bacterium]|nr:tRNA pseudouridine(38-40) synthase TruA [Lachnospiraceae bacterium]